VSYKNELLHADLFPGISSDGNHKLVSEIDSIDEKGYVEAQFSKGDLD
jgi:hypothetical protein